MLVRVGTILGLMLVSLPLAQASAAEPAASSTRLAGADLATLRTAVVTSNMDPDLWRRLAAAEVRAGHLDQAYSAIMRALALAPADRDIQLARANTLLWLGRTAEARAQANVVRTIDPTYPGLGDFDEVLARVSDGTTSFALRSISLSGGLALVTTRANTQHWSNATLGVAFGRPDRTVFEVELDAETRTSTDLRLSVSASTRTPNGSYHFGVATTPDATFRERWRIAAGVEARVAPRLRTSIDFRLASYRSGMVAVVEPGLSYRVSPALNLTGKAINLFDPEGDYRAGGAVRLDLEPPGNAAWFVSAAEYPDREEDGVRRLRALAVGGRVNIGRRWQLRLTGSEENRQGRYRRRAVNIGLTYRFTPQ